MLKSFLRDHPELDLEDDLVLALEENLMEMYGPEVANLVIHSHWPCRVRQADVSVDECVSRASIRVRFEGWHATLLLHPSVSKPIESRHAVDRLHSV